MTEPRPVRVAVTAVPRRPGGTRSSPAAEDLFRESSYSQALLRSLMRAQLGVTVSILAPAAAIVALYPLLSVLFPAVAAADVGPVPLSLVVLGGGIYPPLVGLGFWYVRKAQRVEQRFADLFRDR
jgi:hypothetical protein